MKTDFYFVACQLAVILELDRNAEEQLKLNLAAFKGRLNNDQGEELIGILEWMVHEYMKGRKP